jgi:hypothetical protein
MSASLRVNLILTLTFEKGRPLAAIVCVCIRQAIFDRKLHGSIYMLYERDGPPFFNARRLLTGLRR